MATLQNTGFEGAGVGDGEAVSWISARSDGSQKLGLFNTPATPFENFEREWLSNQNAQTSFIPANLTAALFDADNRDIEDFDQAWRLPVQEGTVAVVSTATLAEGDVIEGGTSGARGIVKALEGGPVIRFTYTNFGCAGVAYFVSGETVYRRAPSVQTLGTGNGVALGFDGTLAPLTVWTRSLHIYAQSISGKMLHIYDNGLGVLRGDIDDVSGTNRIDYATGVVSARFNEAIRSGAAVHAEWDAADFSTATTGAFVKEQQPPYVYQAVTVYTDNLALGVADDFESSWDDNETAATAYADSIDVGTATSSLGITEDYETSWDNNQLSQAFFTPGDLTQGTFVDGPVEDFELTWTSTMQY